jgi:hypothetical protein
MNPAFSNACEPYLAALGFLGQMQEAAVVRRRLLTIDPGFSVERYVRDSPYERVEDREHVAHGLRLAGVAEVSLAGSGVERRRGDDLMPG